MGLQRVRRRGALVLALVLAWGPGPAAAQQWSGCFAGANHLGMATQAWVGAERYGEYFQVYGEFFTPQTGVRLRFSADGHSGAGRLYQRHEYESGALYLNILQLDRAGFVFEVESYGRFTFRPGPC